MRECETQDILFSILLGLAIAFFYGKTCKNGECVVVNSVLDRSPKNKPVIDDQPLKK
jgi:hypothetical protein